MCDADTLIALPDQMPKALLADKGYDADAIRADLARRQIQAVIPGRSNRRIKIQHDRALYKERNHIERFFGRLKINRFRETELARCGSRDARLPTYAHTRAPPASTDRETSRRS